MQSNTNEMISSLMNSFKKDNVILYVGRSGRKELTQEICELPWGCVVTSCTDDIGTEFAAQNKEAIRYTNYRQLPSQLFVKNRFPIIQLYGKEDIIDEALEEYEDDFIRREILKKDAERIFDYVMMRMDLRTRMIIIGYNKDDPNEFPLSDLIIAIRNMRGGVIDIYGVTDEIMFAPFFKTLEKRGGSHTFEKLSELICEVSDLGKEYQEIEKNKEQVFYKGRVPVTIPNSVLLGYSRTIQLLTEENIYKIRPVGSVEQREWFSNFLNDSSEEPQWYGYLKQSEFYIKRDYEDKFISLIRNLLDGRNMKREENIPVLLQGPPGSSKSIELAALAVKIFEAHVNPVIYINSDKLSFVENSSEMDELDSLMQKVESVGEKDTKFLIIWDSSSYKAVAMNAANMIRTLQNRGRRFVLVCTAYGNDFGAKSLLETNEDVSFFYYKSAEDVFVKSNTPAGDVVFDGKFYYIHADGRVSEKERLSLDEKIKRYARLTSEERKTFWDKLEGEENLFIFFYNLMETLRPKLNISLSREQRLVHRFVNQQLGTIEQKKQEESFKDDAMFKALLDAGLVLTNEEKDALEKEESLDEEFDLERFTQIIAMFSRFKLDTPFSLAVYSLYKNSEQYKDYLDTYYSNNSREIFKLITTEIPFIHYCEAESGKHVFRYRNTLEAELFLYRNNIEPRQQLDLISYGLDFYIENYCRIGEVDDELKSALEKILRMIGPNTDYIDFIIDNLKAKEHKIFLTNLELLIKKLKNLRMQDIPDINSGFATIEITFTREYYGKLWNVLRGYTVSDVEGYEPWEIFPDEYNLETYVKRIKNLKNACDLALENIEKLQSTIITKVLYERKYLGDQINGLSVEACLCSDSLKEIWDEYVRYCKYKNIPVELNKNEYSPLRYRKQYEMLVKATITSPLNGYAYNALFRAFEKEYKASDEVRKIMLLSEIKIIADEASDYPIINRGMNGRDDISAHISKIMQYASKIDVTIDSVLSEQTSPFHDLYKKLLEQNNASAICFVCQRELDLAGLGGTEIAKRRRSGEEYVLTEEQINVCQKVMDFMCREEYYTECISKNPYALYLLLRVEWMLFNRRPLSATNEYQLTYVTQEQWRMINEVCLDYKSCAGENIRPIVILIHALSELHLTHDYKKTHMIVNQLKSTDFITTPRMRVPYLVCFEPGKPEEYSGTVISQKNYSGYIQYEKLPNRFGSEVGVRFYMKNMGWISMPENGKVLEHINLGLGFTGFAAYRCDD